MRAATTRLALAAALSLAAGAGARAEDPAIALLNPEAERAGMTRATRVIGGMNAEDGAYPFYTALYANAGNGRRSLCGAAAIAPRWLLTAAHCVQERDKQSGRAGPVRPAEAFRAQPGGGLRRAAGDYEAVRIIPHPEYSARFALQNDIALIELAEPLDPPFLPLAGVNEEPAPGTPVRIVGYGLTSVDGETSARLREADTTLVSREDCAVVARKLPSAGPIDRTRICADVEGRGGLVDSCQGDSGGPLLTTGPDGAWRAAGVVSYGFSCAAPGYPGVYTNVAAYGDWISSVMSGGDPADARPPSATPTPAPSPARPPSPASPTPAAAPSAIGPPPIATPTAIGQIAALVDTGGVEINLGVSGRVWAGDPLNFSVRSRVPGDLFVFDIGEEGDARQIFPNERTRKARASTKITTGRPRPLPGQRDGFGLRAAPELGDRWIVAIVVDGPAPRLAAETSMRGLEPIPDGGDYLRGVVAAVAGPCARAEIRCAAGAYLLRIEK